MPHICSSECELGDWVCIDVGDSARHSVVEVDAVRSAVRLASYKVSMLAKVSRERVAIEIKILKTKAMLLGAMQTGCVREEDCVQKQADCTTHVSPDCQEGLPRHSPLVHH